MELHAASAHRRSCLTRTDFENGLVPRFPACTWYATVHHSYDADAEDAALSIHEGDTVIVQGDRRPPSEDWLYAVVSGHTGLIPAAYVDPLPFSPLLLARILFDFHAVEESELSCGAGTVLHLLPSVRDPAGWCSACRAEGASPRVGIVPQTFLCPILEPLPQPEGVGVRHTDAGAPSRSSWGHAAVPPPQGFAPHQAMDQIFELGLMIARGGTQEDIAGWQAAVDQLLHEVRLWAAWEDEISRREAEAAAIQSQDRVGREQRRSELALHEQRLCEKMAEQGARTAHASSRQAQATEVVNRRRAAIAIQRIWRGRRGRVISAARRAHVLGSRRTGRSSLLKSFSFSKRFRKTSNSPSPASLRPHTAGKASPRPCRVQRGASEPSAAVRTVRRSISFGSASRWIGREEKPQPHGPMPVGGLPEGWKPPAAALALASDGSASHGAALPTRAARTAAAARAKGVQVPPLGIKEGLHRQSSALARIPFQSASIKSRSLSFDRVSSRRALSPVISLPTAAPPHATSGAVDLTRYDLFDD
ncbi:hypothetical protein AB1Y20_019609 [Prymnesium parvum]|uniref:SH3 domain-containing protein n=1 Tax=Prymnesium parvum TaxID=97485 RepID=A0AB34JUU4_PRYPA